MHRVDLIEGQVERWRNRLQPQSIDGRMVDVHTSNELQEELQAFKRADRRRIEEIRRAINDVEAQVSILHRSHADTWEVVSDRVTSEIDRVSATLNERMAEIERAVQTQSALPATSVEQNQAIHEDIVRPDSRIEAGLGLSPAKLMNSERERLSQLKDKIETSRSGLEVTLLT